MKINLSNHDKHEKDGTFRFHVDIDTSDLKVEQTPFGVRIHLGKEYSLLNEPGTPALPSKVVSVALPANATGITVSAKPGKSKRLFNEPVFIMPVPEPEPGAKQKENGELYKLNREQEARLKSIRENQEREFKSIPTINRLMPNPEKYNRFLAKPSPVAELSSVVAAGNNCIVHVKINPVSLDANYIPELHESIDVTINYQSAERLEKSERRIYQSLPQQESMRESVIQSLKQTVINASDVLNIHPYPWVVFQRYNYIVITDNCQWNAETMQPGAPIGDLVAEFERLVAWKRQKGLTARVVTITDIMNNVFGDFKSGAVDLQEVIRNFLKWAHSRWGICWCLLGGDTEVVPIRQAAGECRGTINETSNDPPQDNECFWTGTFMKIKAVSLGEWFSIYDSYLRLTNRNTGRLIPKKAPRDIIVSTDVISTGIGLRPDVGRFLTYPETLAQFRNRLGWYFCTDETYTTYSATPTNFVRVDGAASIIHAPLRFHYTWNTIPTDFYYSSLFGPNYGLPGKHDWDPNNNRVYGQREGATQFDPINWNSDICVGRAPVSNNSEANVFVTKVVSYEQFRRPDGGYMDVNYVDKMLLVSSDWGGKVWLSPTTTNPPAAGRFFTEAAQSRAILQTADSTNLTWDYQLISWIADNDVWLIPYNRHATVGVRGYYFAWSATDLRPAIFNFPLPWGSIEIPLITHTIVVYGNASEIAPQNFVFDPVAADGSMMDQEALRQQVDSQLAFVQRFNRLYEDIDSLPLANRLAAPVSRLTNANIEAALNEGQHFVSLSGHGNQYGCCLLDSWRARSITNNNKFFIGFADSCLTNGFDSSDAMSEELLKNPNGGAVAYVGHTRFSWIGLGDDYQRAFFNTLVFTRHIGLMHRSRLNVLTAHPNNDYHKWSVLALNLLGDPEMEVWKRKPYRVVLDARFFEHKLYVRAYDAEDLTRRELKDVTVKVYSGQREFDAAVEKDGSIQLPDDWTDTENFQVAIVVEGQPSQTFTRDELRKFAAQARAELIEAVAEEEKPVSELLQDVTPLKPEDVPVMEMQMEPQHN